MSRLFWSIFASLVIVTGTAQGVIDQRMDSVAAFVAQGNPINPVWHAQSFTVGMDGELSRINFPVHFNLRVPPSNWQFSWQIIRGDGATLIAGADGVLAAGTALAEIDGHDSMVPLLLPPNLITVKAGDVLAFAVQLTDPDAAWEGAEGNLYTRGSHFVLTAGRWEPTASDLGFQSFVTIPEPSTLAFASLFFLACLLQGLLSVPRSNSRPMKHNPFTAHR